MSNLHPRIEREFNTIKIMIELFCRDHHDSSGSLCNSCQELLDYARIRLKNCPFQQNKTTCGNCSVHCYKRDMQNKVREVMRYSGPRMIYHHPLLAIGHMIDGLRKNPVRVAKKPLKKENK